MPTTPAVDPWLWTGYPVPPDMPALPVVVSRFTPSSGGTGSGTLQPLPNINCLQVVRSIGADPGQAMFRYVFDGTTPGAPQSAEQALNSAITLPLTANVDDQLIVTAQRPDGATQILHHGRALGFGLRLAGDREEVVIQSVGIAQDLWSTPIGGQLMRDASDVAGGTDVATDIPVRFNPKGKPNATDKPSWVAGTAPSGQQGDFTYPTFLDPLVIRTPDVRKHWTLATAARYLICRHVTPDSPVRVPDGAALDALLVGPTPSGGGSAPDIQVSDRPLSGRDWPTALNEFIRDKGFAMSFDLATATDGRSPVTTLRLFQLQGGTVRNLYLQPRGSWLDPALSNVAEADVYRDVSEVANEWTTLGALNRFEAAFVLSAGFPMSAADAGATNLPKYNRNDPGFASVSDLYRLFVLDETGEGHYAAGSTTVDKTVPSLDAIFGSPRGGGPGPGLPRYTRRRRPPIGDLFSLDPNGKPRRYQLAISTDYKGPVGVWDGTGTWQVIEGGYALLKDRLGIRVTTDNPNAWKIGKSTQASAPFPDGIVKVIEGLNTVGNNKPFSLRLTCVIEADEALAAKSPVSGNSALTRTIGRTIDARDRFAVETICASSPFVDKTKADGSGDVVSRDDTTAARAEADAARVVNEAGVLAGPFTIPYLTLSYKVGDRIAAIAGRGIPLKTDNGTNPAEALYPVIVRIEYHLDGEQQTILHVSDQDQHRVAGGRGTGRGARGTPRKKTHWYNRF